MYYLQWRLHMQLKEASTYLKQFGIALKGDLPIGVDKRSVDVWRKPELFRFYTNTGAPPDAFDKNGQNWKFPTYDWEHMKRDGNYSWWRSRLRSMEKYFSLVRVDHILGFFRIWELPGTASLVSWVAFAHLSRYQGKSSKRSVFGTSID